MSLQGIKLITFDATNTILKFKTPPWQYYTVVARDYGFKGTEGAIKERLMDSYKVMFDKYPNFGRSKITWSEWWRKVVARTFEGQLPVGADVQKVADQLIDEFKTAKCWCVADGGHKLLQILGRKDVSIGVISNFDPRLYDILGNVGILKKFKFVVTSYETGFSKPDVRIFKCALDKCGGMVRASESLHIGDDLEKNYYGARDAGWHALIIAKDIKTERPPATNHVFSSLDKLSNAIEQETLLL